MRHNASSRRFTMPHQKPSFYPSPIPIGLLPYPAGKSSGAFVPKIDPLPALQSRPFQLFSSFNRAAAILTGLQPTPSVNRRLRLRCRGPDGGIFTLRKDLPFPFADDGSRRTPRNDPPPPPGTVPGAFSATSRHFSIPRSGKSPRSIPSFPSTTASSPPAPAAVAAPFYGTYHMSNFCDFVVDCKCITPRPFTDFAYDTPREELQSSAGNAFAFSVRACGRMRTSSGFFNCLPMEILASLSAGHAPHLITLFFFLFFSFFKL